MSEDYRTELRKGVAHIDRENAFLLYAAFTGDIERTAAALSIRPADVLLMVDEERWNEKLKGILELKKSGRPGDIERAINRALNFVQAHRMRMIIERVVQRITGMSADELDDYIFSDSHKGKDGTITDYKKLSTRALADLASAIEKCHAMTYLALNDTAQDRSKRQESNDGGIAPGEMHVKIAEAMQKAGASNTPRAQLFDAQVTIAQQTSAAATMPLSSAPPTSPHDNDDH